NERTANFLNGHFSEYNLKLGENNAHSLYFDTQNLELFTAGQTLRDRLGGTSSCGEMYDDQFGLKYRHVELQQAAIEIAYRCFPGRILSGFVTYVRHEIERSHSYPREASELRFSDLPEEISDKMTNRFGKETAEDFVLKPTFSTLVQRRKHTIYLDPNKWNV